MVRRRHRITAGKIFVARAVILGEDAHDLRKFAASPFFQRELA
jgi:hypothetical protein